MGEKRMAGPAKDETGTTLRHLPPLPFMSTFKIAGIMLQIYAPLSKSRRNRPLRPGNRCSVESRPTGPGPRLSKQQPRGPAQQRSRLRLFSRVVAYRRIKELLAPSSIGCLFLESNHTDCE